MDRRYEVFTSSTVRDLVAQRFYVREAIVRLGHIPVGMEFFDPGHEKQWDVIRREIDQCDLYVLIVGARYGSKDSDGLGYTEKEFQYASTKGKPILVFCLSEAGAAAWTTRDDPASPAQRDDAERLARFRNTVAGRLVVFWEDKDGFEQEVDRRLDGWIDRHQGKGWVRWSEYSSTATHRDVFGYLYKNLAPLSRQYLPNPVLPNLPFALDDTNAALQALTILMEGYLINRVDDHIRAYFAYPLMKPIARAVTRGDQLVREPAHFAFGTVVARRDLSASERETGEAAWTPGFLVSADSNLARAYGQQQIKCVDDATVDSRDAGNANQLLANEGSLVSIPIVFSCGADDPQPVGVLGLSSPYKRDISRVEHLPVVREIQALLSSLFYASAMATVRAAGKRLTTRQVAALLRREIAGYFNERQRHPNRARTSEFTVPAAQQHGD